MKALFTIIATLWLFTLYSQTDCKPYVPVTVGSTWEITSYSKKDKETGRVVYELLSLVESADSMTFELGMTYFDEKGEETYANTTNAHCINGVFDFGMEVMMDGSQMSSYKEMDVEVDASKFEVPKLDMPIGSELPDGELSVTIGNNGVSMFTMKIHVTDRVIEVREEMETSAGEFDCVVISQTITTRVPFKIVTSSKEWYAEGVGMVRSESYNKKGKLTGYSILTKIDHK